MVLESISFDFIIRVWLIVCSLKKLFTYFKNYYYLLSFILLLSFISFYIISQKWNPLIWSCIFNLTKKKITKKSRRQQACDSNYVPQHLLFLFNEKNLSIVTFRFYIRNSSEIVNISNSYEFLNVRHSIYVFDITDFYVLRYWTFRNFVYLRRVLTGNLLRKSFFLRIKEYQ